MSQAFEGIIDRFVTASAGFEQQLRQVRPQQWGRATPCSEWTVRALVNHVTRGNLNYRQLLAGATAAEFLSRRDLDALGADPLAAFARSVRACAEAYATPGVLDTVVDYPLGRVRAAQALAVRTTDTVVHTWDLAHALGGDEELDTGLVAWIEEYLDEIYQGLEETPISTQTSHLFFAAPRGAADPAFSQQERLLWRMGRTCRVREMGTRHS